MKRFILYVTLILPCYLYQQSTTNYFKLLSTQFGTSAISINTLTVKTYSFTQPVFRLLPDTSSSTLIVSTRQRDVSGKGYTNKGFHLNITQTDSACCVLQDAKLEPMLAGDYLLFSSDKRSGRFSKNFGYEQFEFPSKIIFPFPKQGLGLTYNSSLKNGERTLLSCIHLDDGRLMWSADIPSEFDWNEVTALNDSIVLIAAGGLHAVNIKTGLLWSHSFITGLRSDKALTYSSFNAETYRKMYSGISTSEEENMVTQLTSNILISNDIIYFCGKDKIIALEKTGKIIWQKNLSGLNMSKSRLYDRGEHLVLVNLGIAQYKENTVLFGVPFAMVLRKRDGVIEESRNQPEWIGINDISFYKNTVVISDKNFITEIGEDAKVREIADLSIEKFGHFLGFIDGNNYFVEKEGFFVPLNFINDNVLYFKTDHGKVFGMNGVDVEYEYHYTELYELNASLNGKKVLSQKNKSVLVSKNFELLHTFNCGEKAVVLKDKIYFPEERLLHIVDTGQLK